LTIVIGGKFETLDLIAPSKEIRDNWVIGLKQIKRVLGEADLATQEEMYSFFSTHFCMFTNVAHISKLIYDCTSMPVLFRRLSTARLCNDCIKYVKYFLLILY
jgi:hypothetical protein